LRRRTFHKLGKSSSHALHKSPHISLPEARAHLDRMSRSARIHRHVRRTTQSKHRRLDTAIVFPPIAGLPVACGTNKRDTILLSQWHNYDLQSLSLFAEFSFHRDPRFRDRPDSRFGPCPCHPQKGTETHDHRSALTTLRCARFVINEPPLSVHLFASSFLPLAHHSRSLRAGPSFLPAFPFKLGACI
jgi:hypothetical protein